MEPAQTLSSRLRSSGLIWTPDNEENTLGKTSGGGVAMRCNEKCSETKHNELQSHTVVFADPRQSTGSRGIFTCRVRQHHRVVSPFSQVLTRRRAQLAISGHKVSPPPPLEQQTRRKMSQLKDCIKDTPPSTVGCCLNWSGDDTRCSERQLGAPLGSRHKPLRTQRPVKAGLVVLH